jgi:hypothetical protein
MKRITLYRNPHCERCRKVSKIHAFFDWLNRVDYSTDEAPSGPLRMGEIEVRDHQSGQTFKGIAAVRKVLRQIPAYYPLIPLTYLPPIATKIDTMVRGCDDGSCELQKAAENVHERSHDEAQ